MKNWAIWGLVGVVSASAVAIPAQAQLQDITKTAGKLAQRVMGKDKVVGSPANANKVSSTTVSATVPAVPAAATDKSARVMVLDKQTNRRQNLILIAGEPQVVGTVQVTLGKCMADYAATLGQDVAWLDVTEGAGGSGRSAPWFSGWMFNTYPEVSTLDHPRYDVQLQGCGTKARQVIKATGSAPIVESAPVGDTETPADPYYVPGVDKSAPATPAAEPVDEEAPAMEAPSEAPGSVPASEPVQQIAPQEGPAQNGDQQQLQKMMDGTY